MNPPNMQTYEARLASFEKAQAGSKRRNSNAKGGKGAKWPHKSPGAVDLAHAGFFFLPTASAPDNVQCFSCEKELDGWDEEDVAILEHRQLSPNCGFALNLGIEYDIENDRFEPSDTDPIKMLDARKLTFKDIWPHEDKRGWACKTQKMAEGGWYYCPTPENDDMVRCAYCGLSLDGWEPKDSPLNEHQRRAPDCVFFSIASGKSTKTSRTAKGRPSKTSRLSIESNATAHTIDDFVDNDDSAMTSMTISSTASKVTKKAGKGRKPKNTRKEAAAPEPEPIKNYDLDDVEMGEPEDAGFDIVVPVPNAKSKRSKKRTSQEMESSIQVNEGSQDAVLEPPPPKRRTTRMRGSTAKSEHVSVTEVTLKDPDDGVASSEKKDLATEKLVRSKKGVKGTRKRASSTVRKASNTSVRKASNTSAASKATLRAVGPTDEELDAALAAELDRPLPDEEIDEELLVESKGKTRRLTRNKPNSRTTSRTVSASKAPIRKPTRASTENQEDKLRLEISKVTQDHPEEELDAASQELPSLDVKPRKGGKVPKAVKLKSLKKTRETSITADTVTVSEHSAPEIVGSLMLHQDIEAEVDLEIPPIVNEEPLIQAGDISTRVSTGLTGQKRRASDITFEAEEKPVKGRKMEIKVEIQRLSSHSQQPIETANDDSVASTADDEKDRRIKKATLPKKQNARKAKGKPSKAKGVSTPHLRQPLFEPTPKQATPTAVKEAATPTNIQIYSPVVVIHVDKQAAHIEEKPPTPHENAIIPASSPSPQSSDAENHPPSTRPMEERPPLALLSPSKTQTTRAPLAASTPLTSPSKRNVAAKIRTDAPWTAIDLENVFEAINAPEDGLDLAVLSSPEKNMTVEEWILHNAARGEERLKKGCERMVAAFELEGVKALRALEGIVCID